MQAGFAERGINPAVFASMPVVDIFIMLDYFTGETENESGEVYIDELMGG